MVGNPAMSILSFTAKGTPQKPAALGALCFKFAGARQDRLVRQTGDPDRRIVVRAIGRERAFGRLDGRHAVSRGRSAGDHSAGSSAIISVIGTSAAAGYRLRPTQISAISR